MNDLAAALSASDAVGRLDFELWARDRPIAGSCLQLATRHIRFVSQSAAVRLDDVPRRRTLACVVRTGWATLTAADIDKSLRSAPVLVVLRAKSNTTGAAA